MQEAGCGRGSRGKEIEHAEVGCSGRLEIPVAADSSDWRGCLRRKRVREHAGGKELRKTTSGFETEKGDYG